MISMLPFDHCLIAFQFSLPFVERLLLLHVCLIIKNTCSIIDKIWDNIEDLDLYDADGIIVLYTDRLPYASNLIVSFYAVLVYYSIAELPFLIVIYPLVRLIAIYLFIYNWKYNIDGNL